MADVPVYFVVSQRKCKASVLKPKRAWSWQGNTTANEIARALSGCPSAIGQFSFKICSQIHRSLQVVTISVMRRKKKKREGTCLIKCPCTRSWIVLKTESSFSPFKAFRHQKCRFSENGPQSGVFSSNASLLETLVSLRNRTAKCSCVINVEGLLLTCFVVIFSLKESEVWRKVI